MSKLHRTKYVLYAEYPDSIWAARYIAEKGKPKPIITGDIAREIVQERRSLQKDGPFRMLLHVDAKIDMTWEAKIYLSGMEGMAGVAAAAIVYEKKQWEVMAHFMPWIKLFPIATKVFDNGSAARDWLTKQPLEYPIVSGHSKTEVRLEDTWKQVMDDLDHMTSETDKTFLEIALKTIHLPLLTKAELEVLSDLNDGLTAGEIAERRKKKIKTVNAQQQVIYHKFNTHHSGLVLAQARMLGIIPLLK